MLVLSRKVGEKLLIGSDVVITIVRIGDSHVRIGIEAPKSLNIVRDELQVTPTGCSPAPKSLNIVRDELQTAPTVGGHAVK